MMLLLLLLNYYNPIAQTSAALRTCPVLLLKPLLPLAGSAFDIPTHLPAYEHFTFPTHSAASSCM
ncbi:hypothetical protein CGMCC3_g13616 [Colletotrichum fructicola]|nr:uncharacterized protein CGMCC3_g13616 [Colletotrichum fructicola]KAE9570282.1 hypothetical protein CGMCC3_g13616 [Colletotrichum fructicola]